MKSAIFLFAMCAAASHVAGWVSPIDIEYYKLWNSKTDEEFIARGIVFYPNTNEGKFAEPNVDLFTDDLEYLWKPHLEDLADLGVNAIRIYSVDPNKPHDKFMCAVSKLGIYVIVGVAARCEECAVDAALKAPECYPASLKTRAQAIINAFIHFPNLLGFSAGNEVNFWTYEEQSSTMADTSLCQKALLRDMKKYIAGNKQWRQVPVGLVSSYQPPFEDLAQFYNCEDEDKYDKADWYGLNPYLYCDPKEKTFQSSEYSTAVSKWKKAGLSIPILLTEYGCVTKYSSQQFLFSSEKGDDGIVYENQRNFLQTTWFLTMAEVQDVFQGTFVYTWNVLNGWAGNSYPYNKPTTENFGIGYPTPENCDGDKKPCKYQKKPEWSNLQSALQSYKKWKPQKRDAFKPDGRTKAPSCPSGYKSLSSEDWPADAVKDLAYSVENPGTCNGPFDDDDEVTTTTTTTTTTESSTAIDTTTTSGDSTDTTTTAPPSTTTQDPGAASSIQFSYLVSSALALVSLCMMKDLLI